jgi:hypothetical protein
MAARRRLAEIRLPRETRLKRCRYEPSLSPPSNAPFRPVTLGRRARVQLVRCKRRCLRGRTTYFQETQRQASSRRIMRANQTQFQRRLPTPISPNLRTRCGCDAKLPLTSLHSPRACSNVRKTSVTATETE